MLQGFLTFIFFITSCQLFGAATVRLNDVDTPIAKAQITSEFTLVVDSPSGDGTSKSAPARVYVPIAANGTPSNAGYSTYFGAVDNSGLPRAGASGGNLKFTLDLDQDGNTNHRVHIGVEESDGKFSIVDDSSISQVTTSANDTQITVSLEDICTADNNGSDILDCDGSFLLTDTATSQKSVILYFFYDDKDAGVTGSGIDLSGNTTGIYYELNLSNKIYTGTINLSALTKGDSQVTANYQGFALSDFYKVNAFLYNAAGEIADQNYGTVALKGSSKELTETTTSGEAKIKNLTNDVPVNAAIFFTDKYKFATLLSNPLSQTPQEIEALLKKNSCFLLTAGFGGDHRIIDFFRNWRDETLAKTSVGREFIRFYYLWGPKMAPVVLENPWLAKSVRGGAHVAYWILESRIWLVMLVFAMGLGLGTLMLVLNRNEGDSLPWLVTVNSRISNTEKALKTQNVEKSLPNSSKK